MKPMNVTKRLLNENDIKVLIKTGISDHSMVENYYALEFDFDAYSTVEYYKKSIVDEVGLEYIKNHTDTYFNYKSQKVVAAINFKDFYNDIHRFPSKTIKVEHFDTREYGLVIYKGLDDNGLLFMRKVSKDEPLAQWRVCNKNYIADTEIDPNISFEYNGEIETVKYEEPKGAVIAYKDNYNPKFNKHFRNYIWSDLNGKQ